MTKLRQSGRCVLLVGGLVLLGCGHVRRDDGSAVSGVGGAAGTGSAGGAGTSAGGAGTSAGGAGASAGGVAERDRTLCENEFVVVPGPVEEVELGFVGTFDGQPTELFNTIEMQGVPQFALFRIGEHLESVYLKFSPTTFPGDIDAQVNVVTCKLWGLMLRRDGDSVTPFDLEAGWLRSTTVTADWETGTTTGSLHFELVSSGGSERHVLDGSFVWPAFLGDSRG